MRLMIVDDQKILLDGLIRIFETEPDIELVGAFTLSEVAEVACKRLKPDILLMDICMEGKNTGIQRAKDLKILFPDLKIVIMTGFPEISFVQKAREAGADSFIYKDSSADAFINCLKDTMAGQHLFPPIGEQDCFGEMKERLTERELEILECICQGMTYQEMADELKISYRTVSFHISNMLNKTGYKSVVGLAVEAADKGYALRRS